MQHAAANGHASAIIRLGLAIGAGPCGQAHSPLLWRSDGTSLPFSKCPSGNILSVWNRLWLPGRRFDLEEAADVDE
jgi:hypothetical protein